MAPISQLVRDSFRQWAELSIGRERHKPRHVLVWGEDQEEQRRAEVLGKSATIT